MKVIISGTKTFYVGWRYENPSLVKLLQEKGIGVDKMKEMKVPEIASSLGMKVSDLPKPLITHCIIQNDQKEKILDVTVKKFNRDAFDVEKARKFSLDKAISFLFPGKQNKEIRKGFWDSYRTRNSKKEEHVKEEVSQAV